MSDDPYQDLQVVLDLETSHRQQHGQQTSQWDPDVLPGAPPIDHDFSIMLLSEENLAPEDGDDAFGAFGPVAASTGLAEDQQQHNVHVLVPPNPLQIQLAGQSVPPVILPLTAPTGNQAQDGGPIAIALPVPVPDDYSKPWENAEYAPLIQWVLAAPDADLIKPFGATVSAHLKPASWKSFRADDVDCSVSLGDQLSTWSDTRIVLDAKNLFTHRYVAGMKLRRSSWMFMCPHCFVLGYAKSEACTGPLEQFKSRSASYGNRQYTYICNSCGMKHQNFTPAKLLEKATEKAKHLEMDLYEYLLGDYEHVIDCIKSKFSNLDLIEKDHYECPVKQTRRQNYEPFMGARIIETQEKAPKKPSQSPTDHIRLPDGPFTIAHIQLPLPQGMSNPSVRLQQVATKRAAGNSSSVKMPRKARKQSADTVHAKLNQYQSLFPELEFWNTLSGALKSYIDSGTLTKEAFDKAIFSRGVSCNLLYRCVPHSYQKGDRFSIQDGEMNNYDYLIGSYNKALARLFSDPDLVSPELKDDCMDALGFGDEEIAALLSKPLPSAQPADMSETNLRVVPGGFDTLYEAAWGVASPSDQMKYSPPTTAGFSGVFGARKSPLAGASFSTGVSTISHPVPNQFKPVGDPSYEEGDMSSQPPLLPSLSLTAIPPPPNDPHLSQRLGAACEIMDPNRNAGLPPNTASLWAGSIMNAKVVECWGCKSKGIYPVPSGPCMTKCKCGQYFTDAHVGIEGYAGLEEDDERETGAGGSNETNCICAKAPGSDRLIQCCLCTQWSHRICYSIDTDDDIKDWCCMHCKPMVYNNLTEGIKRPITGLSSKLSCMCTVSYPRPSAVPGTDIDYDDTNWVQCSNGSCGRVMHSKCYQSHPNHRGIDTLCWQCVEEDDEDDD